MRTNTSPDFMWINSNLNEAIGDIGILYDEFLEEVKKLLHYWFIKTERIEKTFNTYQQYSKWVEKKLKGTSAENHIKSLIDFRNEKQKLLSHILDKYRGWVTPAILGLKLWTQVFRYEKTIYVIEKMSTDGILKKIRKLINILLRKS